MGIALQDMFKLANTSLQSMWNTCNTPEISHGFRNFEIAAGVCKGEHWGPPFHDGDMYKWMEEWHPVSYTHLDVYKRQVYDPRTLGSTFESCQCICSYCDDTVL